MQSDHPSIDPINGQAGILGKFALVEWIGLNEKTNCSCGLQQENMTGT